MVILKANCDYIENVSTKDKWVFRSRRDAFDFAQSYLLNEWHISADPYLPTLSTAKFEVYLTSWSEDGELVADKKIWEETKKTPW
jgi:hypothetical protein